MPEDRLLPPGRRGAAPSRALAGHDVAVADLLLGERDRLDERTRTLALRLRDDAVARVAAEVTATAAAYLDAAAGEALHAIDVPARLRGAGLLDDSELAAEVVTRARVATLDAALAGRAPLDRAPALMMRLREHADPDVRDGATGYLIAEEARHRGREPLPPRLHRRLAWWVAACLRERSGEAADQALAQAVEATTGRRRDEMGLDDAAARLATLIDPSPEDRGALYLDAANDGRLALFVALVARALGTEAGEVRALLLDAAGDELWVALRAVGLGRAAIARIGWALCEADPLRPVERLADALDLLDGIGPEDAARRLDPLSLDRDFRAAIRALERAA